MNVNLWSSVNQNELLNGFNLCFRFFLPESFSTIQDSFQIYNQPTADKTYLWK